MIFSFSVQDNGAIPIVHIDNSKVAIVHLTYAWRTKTDNASEGAKVCIVDGYINGQMTLRRFVFNIAAGVVTEIPMEVNETEGSYEELC